MASSIQILRSNTAKERPLPGNLLDGQPALNTNSEEPGLFFKASDGSIVKIGPAAITSDGSPPNTGGVGQPGNTIGELWLDKAVSPPILKVYDGTQWVDAGSGGSSTLLRWIISASAGQTSLSGLDGSGNLLSYTPGLEEVFVNGVLLTRGIDYIATTGTSITGIAALTAGDVVTVLAYNALSVTLPSANSVTYSPEITNSVQRSVGARLRDFTTSADFGTIGNGTNDDRSALNFLQASSASYVLLKPGTYFLGGDYTFYKPTIFMPGAIIKTGSNLTFTSTIAAEQYQIFDITGSGSVRISNHGPQSIGYPEWWGARINNNGPGVADKNVVAINSCIAACAETVFSPGNYWISTPIRVTTSYRTIRGPNRGPVPGSQKGITRIILSSGSANVMEIETQGLPVSSSLWIQEIVVENLCIHRSILPICPALGAEATGPKGISVQNTLWVQIRNVWTAEHYIGVYINNTIRTRLWEVVSFRSQPASNTTAGPDRFFGFFQDGFGGSFAGGNASTYYQECTVSQGGDPFPRSDMVGFFMKGANSDTYMLRCEITAVGTGVLIDGAGVTGSQIRAGFVDIFLTEFVIDQFSEAGIKIQNTSDWTAIAVNGGYAAPAGTALAPSPSAGLHIENCLGLVSCSNYQTISWPSPSCRGLYVKDSTGVRSVGGMYVGSARPIELDGASKCSIEDGIKNNVGEATTQAAVLLSNSTKNYIRPIIQGAPSIFVRGVDVPAGSSFNEINCTGIDSGSISTGVGRVLRVNGVSVTTPGTYSTNLASGIIS